MRRYMLGTLILLLMACSVLCQNIVLGPENRLDDKLNPKLSENVYVFSNVSISAMSLFEEFQANILKSLDGTTMSFGGKSYRLRCSGYNAPLSVSAIPSEHILGTSLNSQIIQRIESSQSSVVLWDSLDAHVVNASVLETLNSYKDTQASFLSLSAKKELLIVLTTCNQLKMTIVALEYLKETHVDADILIIDDHSVDGTVDYLIKKGYAVIAKERAQGLTDSWNRGYEIAVALGYGSLIFANNDVLVTAAGVRIMRQELRREVLVVPLTSAKGAGHNPSQSIITAYHLPEAMEDYVNNPRHLELIQSVLSRLARNISAVRDPSNRRKRFARLVPSVFHGKARFNGFFFGVNLALIAPAAVNHPTELFDSRDLMVGQEDHLMARLAALNMVPKIAMCAYMFHFKSVTVAAAKFRVLNSYRNSSVSYARTGRNFLVRKESRMADGSLSSQVMDLRDDLRFYHPEIGADTSRKALAVDVAIPNYNSTQIRLLKTDANKATANETRRGQSLVQPTSYSNNNGQLTYPQLYNSYSSLLTDTDVTVYPSSRDMLTQLGQRVADNLIENQNTQGGSEVEIEDSNRSEVTALDTLKSLQLMARLEREVVDKGRIVIAFAISDPVKTPAAGDMFTAQELGTALALNYNVDVRYLHRGRDWYSPSMLSEIDVLVTMLDEYDLGRALSAVQRDVVEKTPYETLIRRRRGVKPTLVTVAWMRNWFQRWLTRPWLGNYDLLLVSSLSAADFFTQVGDSIGFQVQCVMGCPLVRISGAINANLTNSSEFPLITRRLQVPIRGLPLATNDKTFGLTVTERNTGTQTTKYQADYAFSGSYYGAYRGIMAFNPGALLPEYTGLIVGDGWKTRVGGPNVSDEWHRIAIGRVPYEDMSELYHSVKIVIDDANHVTKPWGSVNSRVFDALCAGALVVTNGVRGFEEVFGSVMTEIDRTPLRVPLYYDTGEDLEYVLRYYLSHPQERQRLVTTMQSVVLKTHTYNYRSFQLNEFLASVGTALPKLVVKTVDASVANSATNMQMPSPGNRALISNDNRAKKRSTNKKSSSSYLRRLRGNSDENANQAHPRDNLKLSKAANVTHATESRSSICVGIRTIESQFPWLEILIRTLLLQYRDSPYSTQVDMQIFVVNTDQDTASMRFPTKLMGLAKKVNPEFGIKVMHVLSDPSQGHRAYRNPFYGYDSTDLLVAHMLRLNAQNVVTNDVSVSPACEWIMLTNGDNTYNAAWFNTISPHLLNPERDAVAWDYVTHHKRGKNLDITETVVSVEFKRGFVDLGSVVLRSARYAESQAMFLPNAVLTKDLFARDYFTFMKALNNNVSESALYIEHKCLLFHQ